MTLTLEAPVTALPVSKDVIDAKIEKAIQEAMHEEPCIGEAELMPDYDFILCQLLRHTMTKQGVYAIFGQYASGNLKHYGAEWR